MSDQYTKHNPVAPGDYLIKYKEILDASSPSGVYLAPVVALEPASIGGGGAGGGGPADVGASTAASESDALRQKVTTALRLLDTGQVAGSQLVTAKGDQTTGLWVNVKNASIPVTGTFFQATQPVSGVFWQATQPVSIAAAIDISDRSARLLGHVTVDNVSLAVTGTFWQATQPVSLAAAVDVSDRAARLLGIVDKGKIWDGTNIAAVKAGVVAVAGDNPLVVTLHPSSAPTAAQPVTGTFWQATQPVSIAAAVDVSDRAARLLGVVDKGKVWDGTNIAAVKAASIVALATDPAFVVQHAPQRADAANLCVTNTAATGVACTLTIPAAAAGLFHYISLIEIQLYATAARTGGAAPVLVTTTNLPGSPVWDFDTGQAIGVTIRQSTQPATPIKSSVAATATTIIAPIATTGIWRITAYYYAAP